MDHVAVGMMGLGTVGTGVAWLLTHEAGRITRRSGRRIALKRVGVRDLAKRRAIVLPDGVLTNDPRAILDDPEITILVEAMGGTEPALGIILDALAAGKDVVTANKALLAEHGPEVFAQARRYGRAVAFEGSVAGGIPIVQALGVCLAANQVHSLSAILNGTCNFILTAMTREGISYNHALRQAQELGYAEADPTLDVDGTDTAHKLAILAQLACGASVRLAHIPRQGIDRLQTADIKYAAELGYTLKLLALAKLTDGRLALRVAPMLVRHGTPLADVAGPYNAIRVIGDAVGDVFFSGRGAGAMPTASAVVGDLIDVVVGRASLTSTSLRLWATDSPWPPLATPAEVRSRYYLRFMIADKPGVLATIAHLLGDHGISIASVIQHDPGDDAPPGAPVPLVIMTHNAVEADLSSAVTKIDRLDVVHAPSVCLRVEE